MRPGVNTEKPPLLNEGGYSASNRIRFKDGCAQAIGGWVKWNARQFDSPARALKSWGDLNGVAHTAIGTDTSIYIADSGGVADITPVTVTTNSVPNFSTTAGDTAVTIVDSEAGLIQATSINLVTPVSVGGIVLQGPHPITVLPSGGYTLTSASPAASTVADAGAVPSFTSAAGSVAITVTLANHGLTAQQPFPVSIATTIGGVTLEGTYLVQSVIDANTFTIDAVTAATSAATVAMNGGDARIVYYGVPQQNTTLGGYGVGGYGEGGYGQGVAGDVTLPTVPLFTLDNWGETLVLGVWQGGIFTWTPESGETEAQLIQTAPTANGGIFIAQPQLMVIAWGSSIGSVQQPLLVQWSTAGDYTNWTPTVENQAGNYTIPSGSRIMGGLQGPQQALIWTDVDLYTMNYLGGTGAAELVWGFIKVAGNCGLVAPRAACVLGEAVYWLTAPAGQGDSPQPSGGTFMVFAGGMIAPIHCTVWDKIFQDIDWSNARKIAAASNALFHEVAWYYPSISGGTGECDSYVKFNEVEKVWDYGKLDVTAWQDYSPVGSPLAGHADGYLYQHEIGTSADGQPLDWSLETGAIMIAEGDRMAFADWILPEFQWGMTDNAATNQPVNVSVSSYRFANDQPLAADNLQFSATGPGFSYLRQRGRHLRISYSGAGFARIGDVRIRVAPDGRY